MTVNTMFPTFYSRKLKKAFEQTGDQLKCDTETVPIVGEIPRFVSSGSYAATFGDQWKKYKVIQFDSFTKTSISKDRLDRCLGPELRNNLQGKLVLECGCGAGRFTEILIEKGAELMSSDISIAVEVNKENFPLSSLHQVIQADINDMPFQDESFDIVICLGVLQHTPNPEQAIENLYRLIKKGGTLIIDHYTYSTSWLLRTASFYRWYLKRKPATLTIPFTEKLVKRFLPLHKKFANNKLASVVLNRISPVVSYYKALPQLSQEHQEQWSRLDTHDSLTDWYKHLRSKSSIYNTLNQLGAIQIWCEYGGNGVEARCQKPS